MALGAVASAVAGYFAFQKYSEPKPQSSRPKKVVKVEFLPNSPVVVIDYNDLIHPNVDLRYRCHRHTLSLSFIAFMCNESLMVQPARC